MRSSLSIEIHMLAQSLERIAIRDRRSRDFTLHTLRRAVSETIASFSVYRAYFRSDGNREPNDEQTVFRAVRNAVDLPSATSTRKTAPLALNSR